MKPVIVWFRNDLSLADNPAVSAACARSVPVVAVFIYSVRDHGRWRPGGASRWWLHFALKALAEELTRCGNRLLLLEGENPESVLAELVRRTGAQAVFWNRRYEPAGVKTDAAVKKSIRAAGREAASFKRSLLFEPWEISNGKGEPYRVFTAFWNRIQSVDPPAPPVRRPSQIPAFSGLEKGRTLDSLNLLPDISWDEGFYKAWNPATGPGESLLGRFSRDKTAGYARARDIPSETGTSRMSPYLHFGQISPRTAWHRVPASSRSLPWLRQLVWREFAHHLLYHFPHTAESALRPEFDDFPWEQNRTGLKAWKQGQTGFPFVDAGMRELWQTGWMHNRVRMVTGSFLVKDLRIHWLEGARWFWDTLVDADLANNTMGWQWVAGSGADAAPFFRIFNPVSQGERFDPDGAYVRRWVPELEGLSRRWIHKPWEAPEKELSRAGIRLGKDYPERILDHADARKRALLAYEKIKQRR